MFAEDWNEVAMEKEKHQTSTNEYKFQYSFALGIVVWINQGQRWIFLFILITTIQFHSKVFHLSFSFDITEFRIRYVLAMAKYSRSAND